jgi:pimeloyl-ACP methyl ester carboxylesterase
MKNKIVIGIMSVVALLVAIYFLFPETLFRLNGKVLRSSAGLVKKEVQVDDHQIVYLEGGKGETVLLLHGFGGNKDVWTRFSRNLTTDYHVLIPDLSGFGESSKLSKEDYNIENQVKRLDRFTEVMNVNKFHVAGNSMGGSIALIYSAKHPKKVITLAVFDPYGLKSPNKTEWEIELAKGHNPLPIRNQDDLDKALKVLYFEPPFLFYPFLKVMTDRAISQREFYDKIANDMKQEHISIEPFLPTIQAPVLIIWGDADKILDVSTVPILEKNLKTYKTLIMKDTGHMPMLEKWDESSKSYVSFLKNKN